MTIRITAIVPRGQVPLDPRQVQTGVNSFLRDFAAAVQSKMQDYPVAQPWKRRPPRRGPRREIGNSRIGKRTGIYGKGWGMAVRYSQNSVELTNTVRYAVYVGGPRRGAKGRRQTAAMAARGWPSVSEVAPDIARRLRPLLIRRITGGT